MDKIKISEQKEEAVGKWELVLSKEYDFEGEKYRKIDLGGLDELTAGDMIAINRILSGRGTANYAQENTLEYACMIASRASGQPEEFFTGLPARDAMQLKNLVILFLYRAG